MLIDIFQGVEMATIFMIGLLFCLTHFQLYFVAVTTLLLPIAPKVYFCASSWQDEDATKFLTQMILVRIEEMVIFLAAIISYKNIV